MANRCDCCGKEFSVKNPRKHVKNYEICAACASRLNVGDIENSIKAIQKEAAILAEKEQKEREAEEAARKEFEEALKVHNKIVESLPELKKTFLTTSGFNFEGYKIVKYLNVMSGQVVLGTGFFSELGAFISDIFGASSLFMTWKLEKAKDEALDELIVNCMKKGANAVIGVDLDFMTIGNNMIVACANGTAVVIEKAD